MKNYYDPNFYYTNANYPNIIEIVLKLKDDIDENILQNAVNKLRYRYPYFFVYLDNSLNKYELKTNPYPIKIRNNWEPTYLGSEYTNYHLFTIKYCKNRIGFEMSHSLSDFNGMIPFIKSILYYYICEKYNVNINSDGINLVGSKISEKEIDNPYPDKEIDKIDKVLESNNTPINFYELCDKNNINFNINYNNYIKLNEKDIKKYSNNVDLVISAIVAKSINNVDNLSKIITSNIIVNNKELLNKQDNYREVEGNIIIDYPCDIFNNNLFEICNLTNMKKSTQNKRKNALKKGKKLKLLFDSLNRIESIEDKKEILGSTLNRKRSTISVSYINNKSFDNMNYFIKEIYALNAAKTSDIVCNLMYLNDELYLSFIQCFKNDIYFNEFINLLDKYNIGYEILDQEELRLSNINYENIKSCSRKLIK